jgi:hypothetical protein
MDQVTTSPQWSSSSGLAESSVTLGSAVVAEPVRGPGIVAVVASVASLESLRGVSSAAADVSECVCPESCERDHANE